MDLTIKINMDNEAFEDPEEIRRILNYLKRSIDQEVGSYGVIMDINGNKVGKWSVT